MVVGLPLSKFLMSLSQIILIANWILEGSRKERFLLFLKNKTALIISSIYILHLLGLLYTTEFNYGLEDVRKKIPLLLLPLLFSSTPALSKKRFDQLMYLFIGSIFVATLISVAVLLGIIYRPLVDIREISIFISHIRFSLLICLTIFISAFYAFKTASNRFKIFLYLLIAWFITFLFLLESLTGLIILLLTSLILVTFWALKSQRPIYKYSGLSFMVIVLLTTFLYLDRLKLPFSEKIPINSNAIKSYTSRGNLYDNDLKSLQVENGNYIWQNLAWNETQEAWDKRSKVKFSEKDLKGNDIKYTLIRFLTSKGLKKDADAVNSLSQEEVLSIERGVSNVNNQNLISLNGRLQQTIWELDNYFKGGNPSGHSLTQRFEFWKAAVGIIKENPIAGVGTGDVEIAFAAQYDKMNSPLSEEWRLRSHNQFLSIAVALGLVGLCWFLLSLFFPLFYEKKFNDYFYFAFFLIAFFSMFTEDTLETQAGVSFFAFFNALFLFTRKPNWETSS